MELIVPLAAALVAAAVATLIARLSASKQANRLLTEEIARHKQALSDTQALLTNTELKLRDAFQSLAADALKDNRAAFLDLARTSFAGFHKPIAETLQRVDERLNQTEHARAAAFATLTEQLRSLDTTNAPRPRPMG
jgi:DNA recombination protein RmuC